MPPCPNCKCIGCAITRAQWQTDLAGLRVMQARSAHVPAEPDPEYPAGWASGAPDHETGEVDGDD